MNRKTIVTLTLLSSACFTSSQALAASFPADSRVDGNVASGWTYDDANGDGDGTDTGGFDIDYVSGSFDDVANTLTFEVYATDGLNPTAPLTGLLYDWSDSLKISLDLDNSYLSNPGDPITFEYEAGAWYTFGWEVYNPNVTFTINADHVSIVQTITQAEADLISTDGFSFGVYSANSSYLDIHDGGGLLYVVPEPTSLLLIGTGLGGLIGLRRKKAKK